MMLLRVHQQDCRHHMDLGETDFCRAPERKSRLYRWPWARDSERDHEGPITVRAIDTGPMAAQSLRSVSTGSVAAKAYMSGFRSNIVTEVTKSDRRKKGPRLIDKQGRVGGEPSEDFGSGA